MTDFPEKSIPGDTLYSHSGATRDAIYAKPQQQVADFTFDERVADVFPDMINRSVPGYASMIHGIGRLTQRFAQANTRLYDLGCSLGAATLAMKQNNPAKDCLIIGIDNSKAMVERCQNHVNAFRGDTPVDIRLADIVTTEYQPASVIVLNFTLQFIPPQQRENLLQRLYHALVPGGILILSEKVQEPDNFSNDLLVDLHHEFKRDNGYSELEISQKRAAIENVMRLNSLDEHMQRLHAVGFTHVQNWFRYYNFTSSFAVK
ncbi:MAG: carboxy-S-adenosyl-L-methionine synthase CmoA [Idiomarina sp.]|nr:carboxy-S-adenosyl-L-methionine synthase CmoA [Idiomarina sp.]